ncbi:MAG: HlyD family efflux transporter periplasmic adaptor subunit [Gammaproteobacteria bacterium]|nr:HlyD family efflux transporter periplasmic adaptor subunit [Gammaproteobacteria bacterium]
MVSSVALGERGGPDADLQEDTPVSRLREDLDLYPGAPSNDGSSTWTLHDPARNKFFTLGWFEFEMLKRWPYRTAERIALAVSRETALEVTKEDVCTLDEFLTHNELVRVEDQTSAIRLHKRALANKFKLSSVLLHRYLFFRIPLVRPDQFLSATMPFVAPFFGRAFRWLLMLVTVLGLYLVLRQWSTFSQNFGYFFSWEGLFYFVVALVAAKCLHELGHAYACKYYGLKVPTMGVAFLVMWPFLYTDTTESWKLTSRRQRMAIGAAGMAAELSLAAFCTLLWSFLPEGSVRYSVFFLATASWIMTLGININPFMRWDGYYLLSDLLGVQNLQARAFALGRWRLREFLFGLGEASPEVFNNKYRRLLLLYAYATWLYRFVLFLGIALLVYHFFFKALGLFLVVVEVAWFIGRPIYAEMKAWLVRKHAMALNKNTLRTAAIFLSLVALLLVPWKTHIAAPAVLKPTVHKSFFAPVPARVKAVHVTRRQTVARGDTLFELESPDFEFRFRKARHRVDMYRSGMERFGPREFREGLAVVQQQLREAVTAYRGYREQIERLQVKAPFAGEIVMLGGNLSPGRWVPNDLQLARLVDKQSLEVHAYVTERQLERLEDDKSVFFYPENPRLGRIAAQITEIDRASTISLGEMVLASAFGGPLAVRENPGGELVPRQALYRVRLAIDSSGLEGYDTILRGTVHIPSQKQSLVELGWQKVSAVLVRESGF